MLMRSPVKKTRKGGGSGIIELAISGFLTIALTILCIDIGVLMVADNILDQAARDACRAASGQQDRASAENAANAALLNHQTDGYYITQPEIEEFVYKNGDGDPSRADDAYVSVVVRCNVRLPAPVNFFGLSLTTYGSRGSGTFDFFRRYVAAVLNLKLGEQFR